jgi:hypothetical protein
MSVMDWLFPERVGLKRKARYAVPLGGEFVVDVDSYFRSRPHRHIREPVWNVCLGCLEISKDLALTLLCFLSITETSGIFRRGHKTSKGATKLIKNLNQ